jgi:hypothetical protein
MGESFQRDGVAIVHQLGDRRRQRGVRRHLISPAFLRDHDWAYST